MSQVGRIGGHVLKDQLSREGSNLAFKNTTYDSDPILYLDVNESKIGVKTDAPLYDLDIRTDLKTTNFEATSIAEIDNIRMLAPNTVSTKIGPLYLKPKAEGAYFFMNRMQSDDLDFNDNAISGLTSNQNIELKPSGMGTLEIQNDLIVRGNLYNTENITLDGNVTLKGNITLGDSSTIDTIAIRPQFEQNLEPGFDNTLNVGTPTKRWTTLFTPDLTQVDNVIPGAIKVSDQTWIDGVGMKIVGLQSDDDIVISTTENFGEVVSNPNGADSDDNFGYRVAGNDTYLVVTAPNEDDTFSNEGKVYLFDWNYNLVRTISHPNPAANDRFGSAVDIAPDNSYIAIGAWQEGVDEGVVYIIDPDTGTVQHTIQNPDSDAANATDNFGKVIKADNDYLYVGADSANYLNVYLQEGAVYVFNPTSGTQVQYIPNPSSSPLVERFGRAIATNSTHLFVAEDYRGGTSEGRIRAYLKSTWTIDYDILDPVSDNTGDFAFFISANDNYVVAAHTTAEEGYIFNASNGNLLYTLSIPNIMTTINGGPIVAGADFAVFPHDNGMNVYRMSTGNLVTEYSYTSGQKYLYPIENGRRFILSNYGASYNVQVWKTTKFTMDVEDIQIRENYFENQLNTPLQLRNTGIGYVKFDGTNAMIIPYGGDADRPPTPELGDTRWNSDEQYLESFAGEVENVSVSSLNLTGIPDQIVLVTTTTNVNGAGAELQINIVGETIISTSVTRPGEGYQQGDTLTVSGNQLSGGTTPANDIVYTVGAQTKDGYIIATGGGEEVTEQIMDDLGVIYSLILA